MSKPVNHTLKARLSKVCVHRVPRRFKKKTTKKVKDQVSCKRQFSTGFKTKTGVRSSKGSLLPLNTKKSSQHFEVIMVLVCI